MPLSILAIEKDELLRQCLLDMVQALDHHAVDAQNVATALDMMPGVWFDIVLLSLPFDDPSGAEFAKRAKTILPLLKVIVIGGGTQQKTPSGVIDAFLNKPFSLDQLDAVIKALRPTTSARLRALAER